MVIKMMAMKENQSSRLLRVAIEVSFSERAVIRWYKWVKFGFGGNRLCSGDERLPLDVMWLFLGTMLAPLGPKVCDDVHQRRSGLQKLPADGGDIDLVRHQVMERL